MKGEAMESCRRDFLKMAGSAGLAALLPPVPAASVHAAEESKQEFPIRECYCPAHFGNSYEAMWPREMAAYLAEMKSWGFNGYADWITTTDICSPYNPDVVWTMAKEQLDRKKKAFRAAADLGLKLDLIVTPNHVYLDQLRPQYAAKKGGRVFGQLICPSNPEAREVIQRNFEAWFRGFADDGMRLSRFTAFAYDFGGCECERCKPWIVTFARLMKQLHAMAEKYHPGIEPWFCSWWWTPEEHQLLNRWAASEAPGWLKAMTLHIQYGQTRFKAVELPAGCRKLAFVHIGYSDDRGTGDIYGKWGPVVAPVRIPQTLRDIRSDGADGYQAYSEGVFDDCNKALVAGLASGKFPDAAAVLQEYARRYLDPSGRNAARWAAWLAAWGNRTRPELSEARDEFDRLAADAKPSWRLEHWRSKLALETLDRQIGAPKPNEWTAEKRNLADQFWAETEHLHRDIYKLGPIRTVLSPTKSCTARWYNSWQKAVHAAPPAAKANPEA